MAFSYLEPTPSSTEPSDWHWSPEPIYAFRGWTWDTQSHTLRGAFDSWTPGKNKARHMVSTIDNHSSPSWSCMCGFNAYKTINREILEWPIIGIVSLSGKTIEFERGYRSEYAEIIEVVVWDTYLTAEIDPMIENLYKIKVHRPSEPYIYMNNGTPKRTRFPWRVPEIREKNYAWLT